MRRLPALLALVTAGLPAGAQTASFQGLGDLPGGGFSSLAQDVSSDGAVVVGRSASASVFGDDSYEAFRWTAAGGMVGLGRLPGGGLTQWSEAFGASADGAVVVGVSPATGGYMAFRWTADGGMVGLGRLPNAGDSGATGVSADGAVIVGASGLKAFQWTAESGMVGYGQSAMAFIAWGVSADGSVAIGTARVIEVPQSLAYRRTAAGTAYLGHLLPGVPGANYTQAFDVSADGAVVVGQSIGECGPEAFRWTAASGMVGLGSLPGTPCGSWADGVSADGAFIVGRSRLGTELEAFRWTAVGGMQPLADLLIGAGADITGWRLTGATGVSDDGTVIVGTGVNPQGQTEAWRAVLPIAVSVDPSPEGGDGVALAASPNPVRHRATLRLHLPAAGPVRLALIDAIGRTVALVVDGERGAGEHAVTIDAARLPAGVYVARLDAGGDVITRRVTIVR